MKKTVVTNKYDTKLIRFIEGSNLGKIGLTYKDGVVKMGPYTYYGIYTIEALLNACLDSLRGYVSTKNEFLYVLSQNMKQEYSFDKSNTALINDCINNVQSKTLYTYHYKVVPTTFVDSRIYGWQFGSSNYSVVWSNGMTDSGTNDNYLMPHTLELGKEYEVWLTLDREDATPSIVTDSGVSITEVDD